MARRGITLTIVPCSRLCSSLYLCNPSAGPTENHWSTITNALENAMESQRLTISQFQVSPLKWGVRICKPFVRLSRLRP